MDTVLPTTTGNCSPRSLKLLCYTSRSNEETIDKGSLHRGEQSSVGSVSLIGLPVAFSETRLMKVTEDLELEDLRFGVRKDEKCYLKNRLRIRLLWKIIGLRRTVGWI